MTTLIPIEKLPDFAAVTEWLANNMRSPHEGIWEKKWYAANQYSIITFRVMAHGFGWGIIACSAVTSDVTTNHGVNLSTAFKLEQIIAVHDALLALRDQGTEPWL